MPIDPKKIEEYRTIESDTEGDTSLRLHLYQQAVPALLAEREELIALLRKVEWADNSDGEYDQACPCCARRLANNGCKCEHCVAAFGMGSHAADCELAAFLKGAT